KRKFAFIDQRLLEGRIPEGDRVEIGFEPLAVMRRGNGVAMTAGGETEGLQRLAIKLEDDRVRPADESKVLRPFEIVAIGVAVVFHVVGKLVEPVAAVLDVALDLFRIGGAAPMQSSLLAAP